MIHLAFAIWMMLILLMGMVLYRLWTRLLGHRLVDWLLLPGTVVSELAYANGLLLMGRPAAGGIISHAGNSYAPGQVPTGKYAWAVSAIASLVALIGSCAVAVLVAKSLGRGVLVHFVLPWNETLPTELPRDLRFLSQQGRLVGLLARSLWQQDWLDWRTGAFVYLSICLAVRLGVVRHDWRVALASGAGLLGLLAGLGALGVDVAGPMEDAWPLLSYIWTLLLSLLALTLLIRGAIDAMHIVRSKSAGREANYDE
jgi:hypothetical protein